MAKVFQHCSRKLLSSRWFFPSYRVSLGMSCLASKVMRWAWLESPQDHFCAGSVLTMMSVWSWPHLTRTIHSTLFPQVACVLAMLVTAFTSIAPSNSSSWRRVSHLALTFCRWSNLLRATISISSAKMSFLSQNVFLELGGQCLAGSQQKAKGCPFSAG